MIPRRQQPSLENKDKKAMCSTLVDPSIWNLSPTCHFVTEGPTKPGGHLQSISTSTGLRPQQPCTSRNTNGPRLDSNLGFATPKPSLSQQLYR
ncbi:unnamed protein product, partial [Linum tenue]